MLYTLRLFSSKCSLFHNANFFGSCIIHILYTEFAEIKKKIIIPAPKGQRIVKIRQEYSVLCVKTDVQFFYLFLTQFFLERKSFGQKL